MIHTLFDRRDDELVLRRFVAESAEPVRVFGPAGVGVTALLDAFVEAARGGGLYTGRVQLDTRAGAEVVSAVAAVAGLGGGRAGHDPRGARGGVVVVECVGPAPTLEGWRAGPIAALVEGLAARGTTCLLEGGGVPVDAAPRAHRLGGIAWPAAALLCHVELADAREGVGLELLERLWAAVEGNPGALRVVCARLRDGAVDLGALVERVEAAPVEARLALCGCSALEPLAAARPLLARLAESRGWCPLPLAALYAEGHPERVEALVRRGLVESRAPQGDVRAGGITRAALAMAAAMAAEAAAEAAAAEAAGEVAQWAAVVGGALEFARLVAEQIDDPAEARRLALTGWCDRAAVEDRAAPGPERQVVRFELARLALLAGLGEAAGGLVARIEADAEPPKGADRERLRLIEARVALVRGGPKAACARAAEVVCERDDIPLAARRALADGSARLRVDAAARFVAGGALDEAREALRSAAYASPRVSAALRDEALMTLAGLHADAGRLEDAVEAMAATSAARGEAPAAERAPEVFTALAEVGLAAGDPRGERWLAAAQHAVGQRLDAPGAGRLALRVATLLAAQGDAAAGAWVERVVGMAGLDAGERARALLLASALAERVDQRAEAGALAERAAQWAGQSGELDLIADAWLALARHRVRAGLWAPAAALAHEAVELRAQARAAGRAEGRFSPGRRLADLEAFIEETLTHGADPAQAVEWLGEVLAHAAQRLDPALTAAALRCRGALALRAGHPAPARRDLERARALAEQLGASVDPAFEALWAALGEASR